ncbi:MAG: phage tail protein, partial [Halanaerobiales bacterium]
MQERKNVWVWNSNTDSYEQKPASNPAWACYDIIHRCRRLRNIGTGQYEYVVEGVPANRIDYQAFLDWANFCTDKELQYNGVIYTTQTLWDALKAPEQAGRGRVLMRGTKFSCICDAPSEPVQLFTVSNIGIDSFKEEYLGTSERANAIELTFYNIDNNYEETTIPIYGPGYDELTAVSNPTQVRLDFAMTLEQAYRYGAYQLRVNHYINRAVTWSADIDAIACQAGDVVLLQHDVPRWGWGGRIVSATESTVTLDQKITLQPGIEYGILIRLSDDTIIEKRIESVIEEMALDTLIVTEPFDSILQSGDVYSFGVIEKEAKPFRLTSISRADDFRCTLQGIEYIEEVYEEAEDIPVVDYTRPDDIPNPWAPPARVQNLRLYEEMNQLKDGTWLPALRVSWTKPADPFWKYGNIYISEEGSENWEFVQKVEGVEYVIPNLKHNTRYTVKVVSENRYNIAEDFEGARTASIKLHGKNIPPGDVQDFNIQVLGNGDVLLNWSEVPPTGLGGRGIA